MGCCRSTERKGVDDAEKDVSIPEQTRESFKPSTEEQLNEDLHRVLIKHHVSIDEHPLATKPAEGPANVQMIDKAAVKNDLIAVIQTYDLLEDENSSSRPKTRLSRTEKGTLVVTNETDFEDIPREAVPIIPKPSPVTLQGFAPFRDEIGVKPRYDELPQGQDLGKQEQVGSSPNEERGFTADDKGVSSNSIARTKTSLSNANSHPSEIFVERDLHENVLSAAEILEPSHYELPEAHAEGVPHTWARLDSNSFEVRSPQYLSNKVKQPAGSPVSELVGVEMFARKNVTNDVARLSSAPSSFKLRSRASQPVDMIFVVNMQVPAGAQGVLHCVFYFGIYSKFPDDSCSGFGRLLDKFLAGDPAVRNPRLKMIPRIVEAPWMLKMAVGTRPAIIGNILKTNFSQGKHYFEVDFDVNTGAGTGQIVNMVKSQATKLVIDIAFVLEATDTSELPEKILGCVRCNRLNLAKFPENKESHNNA